jgi:hypothetical protein
MLSSPVHVLDDKGFHGPSMSGTRRAQNRTNGEAIRIRLHMLCLRVRVEAPLRW